ncbi:hypothetical protein ACXWOC_10585, partial [Streptococcus pyogenes]
NNEFITDNGKEMLETLQKNKEVTPLKEEINLQDGGHIMSTNQDQNLRNQLDQTLREEEQKKIEQHQQEELERDSDGDGLSDE